MYRYIILFAVLFSTLLLSGVFSTFPSYPQIELSLRLSVGVYILCLLGFTIFTHVASSSDRLSVIVNQITPVMIILGQCALVLYFYIRSFFSMLVNELFSVSLPVGRFEIFIIISLCLWKSSKKLRSLNFGALSAWFIIFFLQILFVVARELPRSISLSSDPDIHSFSTNYISNYGLVPWDLGSFGPRDLGYPTGFAIWNAIWMWITGIDAINMVAIQTQIQFQLTLSAICAIAYILLITSEPIKFDFRILICTLFFVIVFAYAVFPYGYQNKFFHHEGTARTASLSISFLSTILSIFVLFANTFEKRILLVISPLIISLLVMINPAEGVFPTLLLSIVIFFILLNNKIRFSCVNILAPLTLGILISLIVLVTDPFYVSFFRTQDIPNNFIYNNEAIPRSYDSFITNFFNKTVAMWVSGIIWDYWQLYFYPQFVQIFILIACIFLPILYVPICQGILPARIIRLIIAYFVLVNISGIILVPILSAISASGVFALLTEYVQFSLAKNLLVVAIFSLSLSIIILCSIKSFSAIILSIYLFGTIPAFLLRDLSPNISFRHRFDYHGMMGKVTMNDLIVIKRLQIISKKLLNQRQNDLNVRTPRILIPNSFNFNLYERWIFPTGASRVLPMFSVLPIAFFYNQGDLRFGIDAYDNNVCKKFNLKWMNELGVLLLYVPSNRLNICVKDLRRLIKSKRLIYKKGRSLIVDLSIGDKEKLMRTT